MPTNLQAQVRLKVLDKCLRDKSMVYTLDILRDVVTEALKEYKSSVSRIGERTLYKDIAFLRKHFQAEIETSKELGYHYTNPNFSIFKTDLKKTDIDLLKEVLGTLSTISTKEHFKGLDEALNTLEEAYNLNVDPNTKNVVLFESSPNEKGKKWIHRLKTAIRKSETINVQYQPFDGTIQTYRIFPYLLKEYNNRWFLFCQAVGDDGKKKYHNNTTLGLDRILDVSTSLRDYTDEEDFDFDTFSKHIIGVTLPDDEVQEVSFRVKSPRWKYIDTKPIHHTQSRHDETEKHCTFKITVRPNKELYSVLLSFGADLEVLSPQAIRNELRKRTIEMAGFYS